MAKQIAVVHHADRRTDVVMPYAPGIVVRRGHLVFLSGVTAAPVYHSHPHREEEFDLPTTMREQARLAMENLKKTMHAAGCTLRDLVSATRYLTDVAEQDDMNQVWAEYLGDHVPTTTTVEVSRLATHPRCKLEISAIAVTAASAVRAAARTTRRSAVRAERPERAAGRAAGRPGVAAPPPEASETWGSRPSRGEPMNSKTRERSGETPDMTARRRRGGTRK